MDSDPNNVVVVNWRHAFYLSRSHKLAISKQALPALLFSASQHLLDLQPSLLLLSSSPSSLLLDTLSLIQHTTQVLTLLNAQHYTAWNIRKQLILLPLASSHLISSAKDSETNEHSTEIVNRCQTELKHLALTLSKRPKSSEAWAHRKWVLHTLSLHHPLHNAALNVSEEIRLCEYTVNAHKRNYYSWTHRLHVMQLYLLPESSTGPQSSHGQTLNLKLVQEFHRNWNWLRKHTSDASAAHLALIDLKYLGIQNTIKVLHEDAEKDDEAGLVELLEESRKYLDLYRAGETWWFVRRCLLSHFIDYCLKHGLENCEDVLVRECSTVDVLKSLHPQLLQMANRHLLWILHYYQSQLRTKLHPKPFSSTLLAAMERLVTELEKFSWLARFEPEKPS